MFAFTIGEVDPGATLAAFVGPIAAVGITLWLQARDRSRARKETLLRQLLATRSNPADMSFNIAMALIPVEFNDSSKVRTAHRDFIAEANRTPPTDIGRRLEDLILEMMRALGYDVEAARDALRVAYHSVGLGTALKLQQDALAAIPRLAAALEKQAAASEATLELLKAAQAQAQSAPSPSPASQPSSNAPRKR